MRRWRTPAPWSSFAAHIVGTAGSRSPVRIYRRRSTPGSRRSRISTRNVMILIFSAGIWRQVMRSRFMPLRCMGRTPSPDRVIAGALTRCVWRLRRQSMPRSQARCRAFTIPIFTRVRRWTATNTWRCWGLTSERNRHASASRSGCEPSWKRWSGRLRRPPVYHHRCIPTPGCLLSSARKCSNVTGARPVSPMRSRVPVTRFRWKLPGAVDSGAWQRRGCTCVCERLPASGIHHCVGTGQEGQKQPALPIP